MKSIIAATILLSSSTAMAHDTSFSTDSCDVELEAGIRISKSAIEFSENKEVLYKIIDNKTLFVDGEVVELNSSQQSLVTEYSTSIRAVVPEVRTLAVDGINLAVQGVNLAFDELLGEGNDLGTELTTQLHLIRDEVDEKFTVDSDFYIDENGFAADEFFGEEFEQKIESVVEETLKNSMGSLLIAVGQEMLFSGGDMDALETRMENFGEQIEHEMEARAKGLEKRGEALCHSVQKIDAIEEQLKSEFEQLSKINILTTSSKSNHRI